MEHASRSEPIPVAVVGRGIVGLCVALELAKKGLKPIVVAPREQAGMASLAAVGSANLKGNIDAGSALFALKIAGQQGLRSWLADLERLSGRRVPAILSGSFEPFSSPAGYRQVRERVFHRRFTGCFNVRLLAGAHVRALVPRAPPLLRDAAGAYHYDQDLWFDPAAALAALAAAIELLGGTFLDATVTRLMPHPDRGVKLLTDQGDLWAAEAVLATGVFSNPLLAGAGILGQEQEPVEGETLFAAGIALDDMFLKLGTTNFVTHQGRFFYGSTSRRQASLAFCQPPALAASPLVAPVLSQLSSANFTQLWGIRGRYPDRSPRVGPLFLPGGRRLWAALGFYKNGFQLAPLFAQKLCSTMLELDSLSTAYPRE